VDLIAQAEAEAEALAREATEAGQAELAAAGEKALELVAKAEAEAAELVAAGRGEAEAAAQQAADLVSRAEIEAADLLERSGAQATSERDSAALRAMELVTEAEDEASELLAAARARIVVEVEEKEQRAAALVADAEAKAATIVAKAEDHAEDLSSATREDLSTERDDVLRLRAEFAADQDALAMEKEALEAEKESFQEQRDWLDKQKAEIDKANATIDRKRDILAEAQEAFITERTLLQRRWAETEKQGMVALERAHEEAERILREARDQASDMAVAPAEAEVNDPDTMSADEALALLEAALGETRQEAAERTSAEEAEHGHDNDTGSSGAWDEVQDHVVDAEPDSRVTFGTQPPVDQPRDVTYDAPADGPPTP
jgi:hypothetical protein